MDRQTDSTRAWLIPYELLRELGDFSFNTLLKLSLEQTQSIFLKQNFHRFNRIMGENFYLAVKKIHQEYNDDASKIWSGNQRSGSIVRRFLGFKGIGVKIATMATNILARDFKIEMQDFSCIDISPDVQVRRVLTRLGVIDKDSKKEEQIYFAREMNPDYPGVFDLPCWEIGNNICRPTQPKCEICKLESWCPKKI